MNGLWENLNLLVFSILIVLMAAVFATVVMWLIDAKKEKQKKTKVGFPTFREGTFTKQPMVPNDGTDKKHG